jgi:transcription factor SPN1
MSESKPESEISSVNIPEQNKETKKNSESKEPENKKKDQEPSNPDPNEPETVNENATPQETIKDSEKEEEMSKNIKERSPSPDEDSVIERFKRMRANKKKNKKREDYLETVITLKERLTAAIKADKERIMQGKFGGEKLKLMPKLVEKLGNQTLCSQFLDMDGLDLMGQMIYKFPNGEYPSANTRNRVLKMVKKMPVEKKHILNTKFGGFLTFLLKKKDEIKENKKLANEIKQKWTRIILEEHIDYTMLQNEQHELTQAYLRKRSMADSLYQNKKKRRKHKGNESEDEEKDGLQQRKNFRRTSYNFIVMPKNNRVTKSLKRLRENQKLQKSKLKKTKTSKKDMQGLDVGEDNS